MASVTVTVLAGASTGNASHSIGHTNYEVVPIPLSIGQTFLVTAKTSSAFTLEVSDVDMENNRTFTCLISEFGAPATGTNAYCSPDDAKALAQILYSQLEYADDTAYESALSTLFIPMAQKIIDIYVGHDFQSNSGTLLLDGNGKSALMIHPPYVPVLAASSVTINGSEVVSSIKTYDTFIAYEGGVFTEDAGNLQNIQVTLTYGYAAVPADVQYVCAQITANILADMLRRKLMPDTVARAMQSNADTVVVTGMSKNATILTSELRDALDKYRYSTLDVT